MMSNTRQWHIVMGDHQEKMDINKLSAKHNFDNGIYWVTIHVHTKMVWTIFQGQINFGSISFQCHLPSETYVYILIVTKMPGL